MAEEHRRGEGEGGGVSFIREKVTAPGRGALHSEGSHFRLPQRLTLKGENEHCCGLFNKAPGVDSVLLRELSWQHWCLSRARNPVRGRDGVVMRTAAKSADGLEQPFLASFAAEKGSSSPN